MARYIDVSEIKFTGFTFEDTDKNVYVYLSDVRQAIEQTPTADVEEVKHGEWILTRQSNGVKTHQCSVCGRPIYTINEYIKDYAPYCHCGAKMNGTPKERGGEK